MAIECTGNKIARETDLGPMRAGRSVADREDAFDALRLDASVRAMDDITIADDQMKSRVLFSANRARVIDRRIVTADKIRDEQSARRSPLLPPHPAHVGNCRETASAPEREPAPARAQIASADDARIVLPHVGGT